MLIGGGLALLIVLGGHFNDAYMQQTPMVGNLFPTSVLGVLVVLAVCVNPLLRRVAPGSELRAAELAVIVALAFAVCVVPGSGFLRAFSQSLVLPIHYESVTPSWQENRVLSYVPSPLLPAGGRNTEAVVGAYLEGMGAEGKHISLSALPWAAWLPALVRWVPLFAVLMIGMIGLSLVVHRQWTTHEHLVYPVAQFVQTLIGGDSTAAEGPVANNGSAPPPHGFIVRDRLFWYGFVPILVVHLVNGLHAWCPRFVEIPHRIALAPLKELMPTLASTPGGWSLFSATIYFTVVAFAYFLPSDISLSLGISNLLGILLAAGLVLGGTRLGGPFVGDADRSGLLFGAYIGLIALTLYNGRAYYRRVLRAAFRRAVPDASVEASAVWGLRVFLLAAGTAVVLMVAAGLAWPLAVLAVLLMAMMYTGMSRVCAETGLFYMHPGWYASGIALGFLGVEAIGPALLVILALMSVVLGMNSREAMMPFVVNSMRISEQAGVRKGRLAAAMGGTFVVGLVAGVVMILWLQYDRGVSFPDRWATEWSAKLPYSLLDREIQELKAAGTFERASAMRGLERVAAIRPRPRFVTFTSVGLVLFAACALLRIRFPKWPLHPVLFLVWRTGAMARLSTSFFIGWFIKVLIVRFGGGHVYRKLKPLMIGVIAADLLGGLIWMLVGAIYYAITGYPPSKYAVFPT